MSINKVIFGNQTIMDISDTNTTAADVINGKYFYNQDGVKTQGTSTFNADVRSDTVAASSVLSGVTFHNGVGGDAGTGTIPNYGSETIEVNANTAQSVSVPIPAGYYASGSSTEIEGISSSMIAQGTTLFGIEGSHSGSMPTETGTGVPSKSRAVVVNPTTGYVFSNFTIAQISYQETATVGTNGITATIAGDQL